MDEYKQILGILARRLHSEAKAWRQIYKSLLLLEYMAKNGPQRLVPELKSNGRVFTRLQKFEFVDDDGKDQGLNVRNRCVADSFGSRTTSHHCRFTYVYTYMQASPRTARRSALIVHPALPPHDTHMTPPLSCVHEHATSITPITGWSALTCSHHGRPAVLSHWLLPCRARNSGRLSMTTP